MGSRYSRHERHQGECFFTCCALYDHRRILSVILFPERFGGLLAFTSFSQPDHRPSDVMDDYRNRHGEVSVSWAQAFARTGGISLGEHRLACAPIPLALISYSSGGGGSA